MLDTFTSLKEKVKSERREARIEALKHSRVVRSRGAWFCACNSEELISENEEHDFTTFESLNTFMVAYLSEGAVSICIDGGFDGADNVYDMNNLYDYEPWVSEWSVEVWNQVDGWLV